MYKTLRCFTCGRFAHRRLACIYPLAFFFQASCGGPAGTDPGLAVMVEGGLFRVAGEGDEVLLQARAMGGRVPYAYRWTQERGPEGAEQVLPEAAGVRSAGLLTPTLEIRGEYAFRIRVTDAAGQDAAVGVRIFIGPPGSSAEGPLTIEIDAEERAPFGEPIELTAVAGSALEVDYVWSIVEGEGSLSSDSGATTTVEGAPLGAMRVRVEATEQPTGRTTMAEFDLQVEPGITFDFPPIFRVGAEMVIAATVEPEVEGTTFLWELADPEQGILEDGDTDAPLFTAATADTIAFRLTVEVPAEAGSQERFSAVKETSLAAVGSNMPQVRIETNLGDLVLELNAADAPKTAANFLRYVDEGFYEGILFHRYSCEPVVNTEECKPFVIQGGGFRRGEMGLEFVEPTHDPVESEADNGLSNLLNTVAMALVGGDTASAQSQFFINLTDDNARLDDLGFTAFGRVIEGLDVLEAITKIPTTTDAVNGLSEVPEEDVVMIKVQREGP